MKKNLWALLVLSGGLVHSQDIRWDKSYGGNHAELLFDAVPTADYGFILAGSSVSGKTGNKTSANQGDLDYWVWKMDENGELVWQKNFGGSGFDLLQSIKLTPDGGFLLAGSSNSPKGPDKLEDSKGGQDFWVIKLDAGGGVQWQKTLGGDGPDELVTAVVVPGGGYLLCGRSESGKSADKTLETRGNMDYWLVRLDAEGRVLWDKSYGGKYADMVKDAVATPDGGFLIGGTSNSPESIDKLYKSNGQGDYWVLKLDKSGAIEWQQVYGGDQEDDLTCILPTIDGNYILAGYSASNPGFNKTESNRRGIDFWVIKINDQGHILWQKTYDYGEVDILSSVLENPDGTLILAGFAKPEGKKDAEGINDYLLIKTDPEGEILWDRTIGSDGEDILRRAIITRDGGYLLAGTSNPQAKTQDHRKKKGSSTNSPDLKLQSGNLAAADKLQSQLDQTRQQSQDAVNELYAENRQKLNDGISDITKSSGVGMSVGGSDDLLKQGSGSGQTLGVDPAKALNNMGSKKLPPSKNNSGSFGDKDFWVVKLKDKDKQEKPRTNLEAIPNPARGYTNIIVGYEYNSGTATLYDLGGRQLRQFPLDGNQTIPVDLSGLPEGIYLVEVKTDRGKDAVKVMNSK